MDELTKRVYDFAKERLDGLTRGDGKTPVFEGHAHNYLSLDPKNKQRRQKYEASALALELYNLEDIPTFNQVLEYMETFVGHTSN